MVYSQFCAHAQSHLSSGVPSADRKGLKKWLLENIRRTEQELKEYRVSFVKTRRKNKMWLTSRVSDVQMEARVKDLHHWTSVTSQCILISHSKKISRRMEKKKGKFALLQSDVKMVARMKDLQMYTARTS